MSEEQYIYVEFPPNDPMYPLNPIDFIGRTVVVISTRKKWYSDGSIWEAETGVGGAVGSLDAASPISGNPVGLQTPGQMAAVLQAQAAQIAALQAFLTDTNFDGRLDADKQESNEYDFLAPSLIWNIPHNFGRKPEITCYDLSGSELDNPPRQDPSDNTSIITWLVPQAGKAVCS